MVENNFCNRLRNATKCSGVHSPPQGWESRRDIPYRKQSTALMLNICGQKWK
jgi:hypothetical protein